MVKSGVCPQADVDANWVVVKQDDAADATDNSRDYFGTFHFDAASEMPSLPALYSLADPLSTPGTGTISGGGCVDGSYAGMLFNANVPAGRRILPVAVACTPGNCVGDVVDDIDRKYDSHLHAAFPNQKARSFCSNSS
jgi:hypothetical protein